MIISVYLIDILSYYLKNINYFLSKFIHRDNCNCSNSVRNKSGFEASEGLSLITGRVKAVIK